MAGLLGGMTAIMRKVEGFQMRYKDYKRRHKRKIMVPNRLDEYYKENQDDYKQTKRHGGSEDDEAM
jgi:hypothetical protein